MQSAAWDSSAFVLTYDQSGGWYDHVPPPRVDAHGYGFRVPALLVSPYARAGHIDRTQLDFTSLLRFIEDNYGLAPLTERDAKANSIAPAFDFISPPRAPEIIPTARPAPPRPEPRRIAIYGAYSGALIIAGLIVAWAKLRTRRPGQRPVPPGPRTRQDGVA
jgi:phospholipase C